MEGPKRQPEKVKKWRQHRKRKVRLDRRERRKLDKDLPSALA